MIRAYHVLMMFRDYGLITLKPDPKGSPPLPLTAKSGVLCFICVSAYILKWVSY